MEILPLHSIKYLAAYMAASHEIAIRTNPDEFVEGAKPKPAEEIEKRLLEANKSAEGLYEYLEDFGSFINDPMFEVILNLTTKLPFTYKPDKE